MNALRTRLFLAIAGIVVLSIGATFGVGLTLTRREVEKATLRDVSHQADLLFPLARGRAAGAARPRGEPAACARPDAEPGSGGGTRRAAGAGDLVQRDGGAAAKGSRRGTLVPALGQPRAEDAAHGD